MRYLTALAAIIALAAAMAQPASDEVNNCSVPAANVTFPPDTQADTGQGIMLTGFFLHPGIRHCLAATDLQGVPSWTYCSAATLLLTRWVPGGTILFIANDNRANYRVQEINLAGATLHSYSLSTANQQLSAKGQQTIIDFDHEALRLPNGYTALIAHNERLETDVQGPGTLDVLGDEVLVLDANWNLVWTWNAFDWLPVSRTAILGETCQPCNNVDGGQCCPITLAPIANDWLHGNSLAYDSSDGNLIMSLRNQDWVIKIAYQNGTGDGHVVWSLGSQGTFAMINTPRLPSPWFSHQHDVEIQATAHPKLLMLFDNGNTRRATDSTAHSRGQVLSINEQSLTADIHMNVDLGLYSAAYGTAQLLNNGNYWWQAGVAGGKSAAYPTRSSEYVKSGFGGNTAYSLQFADTSYRSFRLTSLTGTGF